MKKQLDNQLISLLEITEKLSSILCCIKILTKFIIDERMNKPSSLMILKKDNSFMKYTMIDQSDERIISLLKIIDTLSNVLSEIRKNTIKRSLNREFYLTDKEISARLKVSRRTLQEWRYSRRIQYFQIGGKILFRESDIQALLEKNLRSASR